MPEVTFIYTVSVEEKDLEYDEAESCWQLKKDAREGAYEQLIDGISDLSGNWYPRHNVLCLVEFMAGAVCDLPRDHDGAHASD